MSDAASAARPPGGAARRHRAHHGRRPHGPRPTPTCWSSATGSPRSDRGSRCPTGTQEIDASGGIVMPGMIDTHRHMWQTAMRGYGADWTLTQYFVWYYLEHGKKFRPEDIARRQPARRPGSRSRPASPPPSTGRTACRPSTTPRPRSTRCRRCPAGSCWPTATSRPARGSGPPTRPSARFLERRRDGARRHARRPAGLRRHRRPGLPGEGGVRGGPRPRPRR